MSNVEQSGFYDGGPAFPRADATYNHADGTPDYYEGNPGMSLRDWFAGQALAGLYASARYGKAGETNADYYAKGAYLIADAMLKAREES